MKITDNIHILSITGVNGTAHSALIVDGDDNLLVDCGFPGYWDALEAALSEAGIHEGGIKRLLITHQDIDHIGCVNEVKRHSPDVRILAHQEEAPYIDGTKTPVKLAAMEQNIESQPEERRAFLQSFRMGFENRRTHIDETLGDGDILPLCGGVHVFFTPGHTPGHICLYIPAAKLLIAGDELNIRDGKLIGPTPQYTYNTPLALTSLHRLAELSIEKIICYHGGLHEHDTTTALKALADSPKTVLACWVQAFNRADADALAAMYHEDAVNHQVANEPVVGREAIRVMLASEFAAAEMVCIVDNLFEDGEWAIMEWRDPLGLLGCGFFHIINGKIKFQRGYWDKLSFLRQHDLPV